MSFLFCFPGQGSQSIGMLDAFADSAIAQQTLAEADDALQFGLSTLIANGPIDDLNQTHRTQPAMLAADIVLWREWLAVGGTKPSVVAGHSLGEYSALVAAGVLDFAEALRLVQARGHYMQEAVPLGEGAMAAIVGLADADVESVCAKVDGVAEPVNYNAPGQVVIAGSRAAVEIAMTAAKEAGARMVREIPVSAPAHSSLMRPAAQRLQQNLANTSIYTPEIPVLHNVDAATHTNAADITHALVAQVHNPVRWVGCVEAAKHDYDVALTVECGPGGVLRGLNRRIDKSLKHLSMDSSQAIEAVLSAISAADTSE